MKSLQRSLSAAVLTVSASAAVAATTPELYADLCAVCHTPGIAGAPKVGDQEEWARRVRAGMTMLYRNALEGMPNTAMMPKGGHTQLNDNEVKAIVDYMLAPARLSPATLRAAAQYEQRNISNRDFIRIDANYDGFLSREELAGDPLLLKSLARFDMDRDGKLSMAEFESAEVALESERMAVKTDDRALIAAVRAAITAVKGIDLEYIKVESVNGVVAVIGVVEDAGVAMRATDVLKRIPGIQKIDNRLVSGHQIGWD